MLQIARCVIGGGGGGEVSRGNTIRRSARMRSVGGIAIFSVRASLRIEDSFLFVQAAILI